MVEYNTYMTTRKLEDKNIRKITRVGRTSLAVTLPVEMVKDLGWKEKQKVKIVLPTLLHLVV